MSLEVRLANNTRDRSAIIDGLKQHLNPLTDARRFDWLYLDNPDGQAHIWVLEDVSTRTIIGSTALLPRQLYIDGHKRLGCVVADTWVHPDHRVLGPALKLQRACLDYVQQSDFALAYDFPRQAMPAIYARLGYKSTNNLLDFVRLLRFESFLANRIGPGAITRFACQPLNWIAINSLRRNRETDISVGIETNRCSVEFDDFDKSNARNSLRVARSSAYLNWRYHDHFNHRHEFLVARRKNTIVGYLIYISDQHRSVIVDLASVNKTISRTLIVNLAHTLATNGVQSLQVSTVAGVELEPVLRELRFQPQSAIPLILIGNNSIVPTPWHSTPFFMLGHEAD